MKIIVNDIASSFPFEKYCRYILAVAPKQDIVGIEEIRFLGTYTHPKSNPDSMACYLEGKRNQKADIEVHIENIKNKIPKYILDSHFEIGGLLLSEIIFHEIGHHVARFKRHGIGKDINETFANKYAKAGYLNYLLSRKSQILSAYWWNGVNIFQFDKDGRRSFRKLRADILDWIQSNNDKVLFP